MYSNTIHLIFLCGILQFETQLPALQFVSLKESLKESLKLAVCLCLCLRACIRAVCVRVCKCVHILCVRNLCGLLIYITY